MTGFRMRPGNDAIVHHAIAFLAPPTGNTVATLTKADGADGQPGYSCFDGTGPSILPQQLGGWAPGNAGLTFGVGDTVGTRVEPGTKIMLQVHYHVEGNVAAAAPDQSILELQTAESVAKEGHLVAFLNPLWVIGQMPIGVNDPDARAVASGTVGAAYRASMGAAPTGPLAIYNFTLHMHVRGSRGGLSVTSGSKETCLLNISRWNFHWQDFYVLEQPVPVQPTDTLNMNCHWDNSQANQPIVNGVKATSRAMNWGEGTNDEMCLGALYLAPP